MCIRDRTNDEHLLIKFQPNGGDQVEQLKKGISSLFGSQNVKLLNQDNAGKLYMLDFEIQNLMKRDMNFQLKSRKNDAWVLSISRNDGHNMKITTMFRKPMSQRVFSSFKDAVTERRGQTNLERNQSMFQKHIMIKLIQASGMMRNITIRLYCIE
eukprot:TRINITY_DN3128_c0_g3_i1.p1 TRINITY_DN3128_c0_g3~~TRINITY_DN3128_c0_g3_i1.p1  ORF type:complete len:155 (-),score=18.90 TRINITY_DN3128_c0_g3_i1:29-493(-)